MKRRMLIALVVVVTLLPVTGLAPTIAQESEVVNFVVEMSLADIPAVAPADDYTVIVGMTVGGAYYKIVVPTAWNGDLVIWNHGFSLEPPTPDVDLGPFADLQLSEGYAVAASSYQQIGWALFKTKYDLQNLYQVFRKNFGKPNQVFLTGGSLGGIVTAAAIEEANLGNVVGAYPICGAVAGSRNWDGALDMRLIYDVVCSNTPTAYIPGGAEGLPAGSTFTPAQLAFAVNECTGVLLPPDLRTPTQIANLDRILQLTTIPENFLMTVMGYATFSMSDLVHDRHKLSGHLGTGNAGVVYGDAQIDALIARVSPNPGAANRLEKHYTPNGEVGDTKIITLHTDKDGLVIVENESEYADVVPPENLVMAIVVEAVPTHCGFSPAEAAAGWESLRAWVAGAPQPTAASIQLTCMALEPVLGGPCRIDPSFVVPDMDTRIRPR